MGNETFLTFIEITHNKNVTRWVASPTGIEVNGNLFKPASFNLILSSEVPVFPHHRKQEHDVALQSDENILKAHDYDGEITVNVFIATENNPGTIEICDTYTTTGPLKPKHYLQ